MYCNADTRMAIFTLKHGYEWGVIGHSNGVGRSLDLCVAVQSDLVCSWTLSVKKLMPVNGQMFLDNSIINENYEILFVC